MVQKTFQWSLTYEIADDQNAYHSKQQYKIGPLTLTLSAYPNGTNRNDIGSFITCLTVSPIACVWKEIYIRCTIHCKQTETIKTHFDILKPSSIPSKYYWKKHLLPTQELVDLELNHLKFVIDAEIIKMISKDSKQPPVFRKAIISKRKRTVCYELSERLRSRMLKAKNEDVFESKCFYNRWMFVFYPKGKDSDDQNHAAIGIVSTVLEQYDAKINITCPQIPALNLTDIFEFNGLYSGILFEKAIDIHSFEQIKGKIEFNAKIELKNREVEWSDIDKIKDVMEEYKQQTDEKILELQAQIDKMQQEQQWNEQERYHGINNQEIDSNDSNGNKYKEALCGLIHYFTNPKPRMPQSSKCKELEQFITSQYDKKTLCVQITDILPVETKQKYTTLIKEYLQRNKDYDPLKDDASAAIIINDGMEINQNEILEIWQIANHRIEALNGQKGLRALISVAPDTIIGEYFGCYMFQNDLDDVYGGTIDYDKINEYAFSTGFNAEMSFKKAQYFTSEFDDYQQPAQKKQRLNGHRGSKKTKKKRANVIQGFNVVLDAYSLAHRSPLTYINDGRENIKRCVMPSDEDSKHINCQFTTALINGWPKTFAVTTKHIKAGDEIMAFYGVDYGLYQCSHQRYNKRQRHIQNEITHILESNNIDTAEFEL